MEKNEKELSPQESLALIQTMINKTKDSVADDSFYFLLWGWLVFACGLGQFVLKVYVEYPKHYFVWWLMPVGGIVSAIYGAKQSKERKSKSFVDEAVTYLWMGVGLGFITVILINAAAGAAWQISISYYILLYAIGTSVSGRLLRFRPLIIGGLVNFALAAVAPLFSSDYQMLVGCFAILTSYIIPGHMLRARYRKHKN